jgi:endonuclease III
LLVSYALPIFAMNRILSALALPAVLLTISFSSAQTPDANQEQKLLALIKDVQTQQAQMAANQAKIDEKLNDLADIIRDARLYSKRSR